MRGAIVCVVLCLSPAAAGAQILAPPPERAERGAEDPDAAALIAAVNRVRTAHGLTPVSADPSLMAAATDYAQELSRRGALSHRGADGTTPVERAQMAGYEGGDVAEALAAGYSDPGATVEAWMESPMHRDVVLKLDADAAGVARQDAQDEAYQAYWTLLLAAPAQ